MRGGSGLGCRGRAGSAATLAWVRAFTVRPCPEQGLGVFSLLHVVNRACSGGSVGLRTHELNHREMRGAGPSSGRLTACKWPPICSQPPCLAHLYVAPCCPRSQVATAGAGWGWAGHQLPPSVLEHSLTISTWPQHPALLPWRNTWTPPSAKPRELQNPLLPLTPWCTSCSFPAVHFLKALSPCTQCLLL